MSKVCITYHDSSIQVATVTWGHFHCASIALPTGLVSHGEITDTALFAQHLQQAFDTIGIKPTSDIEVIVALPEEHAFMKVVSMPRAVTNKELSLIFDAQWETLFPIPKEQIYYTYRPLHSVTLGEAGTLPEKQLLIIAYNRDRIEQITSTLQQYFGIIPDRLIPSSFGLAELFSQRNSHASLVVTSEGTGTVVIAAIKNKVSYTSSAIHAPSLTGASLAQIRNVKNLYEKDMTHPESSLTQLIFIDKQPDAALVQQLSSLNLAATIIESSDYIGKHDDPACGDQFLPLLGLLRSHETVTLLPPTMVDQRDTHRQARILRISLVYMASILMLVFYFSVAFLVSLKFTQPTRSYYPSSLVTQVAKDSTEVESTIISLNQIIARITELQTTRTHAGNRLQAITTIVGAHPGIALTGLTYENDKHTVTLTGNRSNRAEFTAFQTDLQNNLVKSPGFEKSTVDSSLQNLQDEGAGTFTIIIKEVQL